MCSLFPVEGFREDMQVVYVCMKNCVAFIYEFIEVLSVTNCLIN